VVIGRAVFGNPDAFAPLLSTWGGECMYMADGPSWKALRRRLRQIGRPAIIQVRVSMEAIRVTYPSLDKLFAGASLGLLNVYADGFLSRAVLPEQIESIWRPGDSTYDRQVGLPRE
jgi:hypothetical protein